MSETTPGSGGIAGLGVWGGAGGDVGGVIGGDRGGGDKGGGDSGGGEKGGGDSGGGGGISGRGGCGGSAGGHAGDGGDQGLGGETGGIGGSGGGGNGGPAHKPHESGQYVPSASHVPASLCDRQSALANVFSSSVPTRSRHGESRFFGAEARQSVSSNVHAFAISHVEQLSSKPSEPGSAVSSTNV